MKNIFNTKIILLFLSVTVFLMACSQENEDKKIYEGEEKAVVVIPVKKSISEEPTLKEITQPMKVSSKVNANTTTEEDIVNSNDNPYSKANIEIKAIHTESVGWGYDIYVDGKKFIHQYHIPAIDGLKGFQSEQTAKKTAGFIVYKIRNNIIPPSISIQELDSLNVLN